MRAVELLNDAIHVLGEKAQATKDRGAVAKLLKKGFSWSTQKISLLKRLYTNRGKGQGADKVTVQEGATKIDPLTKLFSQLIETVNTFAESGLYDDLTPYLEDLKKHGIELKIAGTPVPYAQSAHDMIIDMLAYQNVIDDCSERLKNLGEQADAENEVPKSKFASIASLAYKKSKGKQVEDKIQQEFVFTSLYEKALETVQSETFS